MAASGSIATNAPALSTAAASSTADAWHILGGAFKPPWRVRRDRTHGSCTLPLSEITDAIVLHEHPERRNQNALRAFLPNRASAPALPKRPLSNRRLHADHVPDARARWRAMTAKNIQRSGHALASGHLVIGESPERRAHSMVTARSRSGSHFAWNRSKRL